MPIYLVLVWQFDSLGAEISKMSGITRLRILSILLAFLTGLTALIFQNIWHRYLTYLLGSQSQATAIIIAVFLGGMAIGYFLYGHLCRVFQNTLFKLYGATEFLIGVWAVFSPKIYSLLTQIAFDHFFAEIGIAILFLGVPTILMGGTIPVLTQALSTDLQSATRIHSRVYAFNTFGAAAGSLLAGFYLLPNLGLPLSLFYAGTVNILVGTIFYLANKTYIAEKTGKPSIDTQSRPPQRWLWAIAFTAGFVTIGLETILIRIVGLSIGSSVYSFSIIVAIFIFCIALGGFLVGCIKEIPAYSVWLLQSLAGFALLALYNTIETWPYFTHIIRTFFTSNAQTFPVYYGALIFTLTLVLLVPISLCGSTLPLCFHFVKRTEGDLGSETGKLYAINTVGCVLGALLAGYYFLFSFDLNEIFIFLLYLMFFSSALSLLKLWRTLRRTNQFVYTAVSLLLFATIANQPLWDNQYFALGLFRNQTLISSSFSGHKAMRFNSDYFFYRDGPVASVSVLPHKEKDGRLTGLGIQVNGKTDGNSQGDFDTMQILGHLPTLFAERAEKVCVIGFGTGMTAGVVTQYNEVKRVDLVEINPVVLQAGKLFAFSNYNALSNPKTHVFMMDAFRFFRAATQSYDLIISEPSNPWMVGVENLFSRDFYGLAHKNLAEQGIFVQWFHGYSLSPETLKLILNTFRSVFPHYHVFNLQESDYALVGMNKPLARADLERIQGKLVREKESGNRALADLGMDSIEQFLSLATLSETAIDTYAEGGGIHTLENPKLGYWAGLDFFSNKNIRVGDVAEEPSSPSLLSQWENILGHRITVGLPDSFCERNNYLCDRLKIRNKKVTEIRQNHDSLPLINPTL